MLEVGERVDNRFEVEARVGAGGMAEVYRVRHLSLGSVYALKVLSLPHPGLRERFLREGQIQAQIRHPNVVAVTDVLEHRGRLGLLMEYVDHVSLQELLDRQGAIPLEQSLQIFARILSGVSAAHASGVLHRDLKPANILLARSPQGLVPKITDFGIAKVVLEGMPVGATRDGSMMGTPGYMAPEQATNARSVDQRADVFALGAILYTMLVGATPFDLEDPDLFQNVMDGRFPPLETVLPSVPPTVAAAVHAAMAPDPNQRLPTALALSEALFADRPELLALVVGSGDAASPVVVGAGLLPPRTLTPAPRTFAGTLAPNTIHEDELPEPGARPAPSRARAALWVALVGGGVGLLAVLGLVMVLLPSEPDGTVAPEAGLPPAETTTSAPVAAATPSTATPSPAPEASPTPTLASGGATSPAAPASGKRTAAPTTTTTPPEASPAPASDPTPQLTTEPEPAEATAAPTVEAEPEATPEPEAAAPEVPALRGTWSGTASGRPATLRVQSQSGTTLKAELSLTLGSAQRIIQLSGSIDPATGAVRLQESGGDNMVLTGTFQGNQLAGTYMRAGQTKALPWAVGR